MSPARRWVGPGMFLAAFLLAHTVAGCDVAVKTRVSDAEAKSVVALLHAHHLGASTRQHAVALGPPTFDVVVIQSEAAQALLLLRAVGTSDETAERTAQALERTKPVPTVAEEQAQFAARTAHELERVIALWDGVVNVRIQITPTGGVARPLGSPTGPDRVAVVIKHRPSSAPTLVTIRELVRHSIPGLRPEHLFVVLLEARPPVPSPLVQVGPIAVTRGSAEVLRLVLVTILSLLGVCAVLVAWTRTRQNRTSAQD